jgi:hypothetical protein
MAQTQTLIKAIQNDNKMKLIFYITKEMRVESLLGATITLQFIDTKTGETMTRNCDITDAQGAECVYILTSNDLKNVGNYMTELTVEYSNGTKLTKQNPFVLSVAKELVP